MATSRLWLEVAGKKPWWWWESGPYLRELGVWKGKGGVPIGNFVGWWLAPFFIVLIFYMVFQKRNEISGKLVNAVPWLIYFYMFFAVVIFVLEMNWFEDGYTQVALIAFFTMMPLVLVGLAEVRPRLQLNKGDRSVFASNQQGLAALQGFKKQT